MIRKALVFYVNLKVSDDKSVTMYASPVLSYIDGKLEGININK